MTRIVGVVAVARSPEQDDGDRRRAVGDPRPSGRLVGCLVHGGTLPAERATEHVGEDRPGRTGLVDDDRVDGRGLAFAEDERDQAGDQERGDEQEGERRAIPPDLLDEPAEQGDHALAAHRDPSASPAK